MGKSIKKENKGILYAGFQLDDYFRGFEDEAKQDEKFCEDLLKIIDSYSQELIPFKSDLIKITYEAKKYYQVCLELDSNLKKITNPYKKELNEIESFMLQYFNKNFQMEEIVLKSNLGSVKIKHEFIIERLITVILELLNESPKSAKENFAELKSLQSIIKSKSIESMIRKSFASQLLDYIVETKIFPIEDGKRASNTIYNLIGDLLSLAGFIDKDKLESNLNDYVASLLR